MHALPARIDKGCKPPFLPGASTPNTPQEWHKGASQHGPHLQHEHIDKKNVLGVTGEATQAWGIPRKRKNQPGCKWSSQQPAHSSFEEEEFMGGPAGGSHPGRAQQIFQEPCQGVKAGSNHHDTRNQRSKHPKPTTSMQTPPKTSILNRKCSAQKFHAQNKQQLKI